MAAALRVAFGPGWLVRAHLIREDMDKARASCADLREMAAEANTSLAEGISRLSEAAVARAAGDIAAAEALLAASESAMKNWARHRPRFLEHSSWTAVLELERGHLHRAHGRLAEATEAFERAAVIARRRGLPGTADFAERQAKSS